jgi:uncharacterized FlgJ-related protein
MLNKCRLPLSLNQQEIFGMKKCFQKKSANLYKRFVAKTSTKDSVVEFVGSLRRHHILTDPRKIVPNEFISHKLHD